ncbi:thioredoxin family protein [Aurantiacibacter luteus]|uniref:thioredoxin family protein n=1 Tax=Aurantiacibacter luteus TaxID=1581420 RepID=UPI0007B06FB8|nr:thioredoxin family protein [Aurantiacibacter luteus]
MTIGRGGNGVLLALAPLAVLVLSCCATVPQDNVAQVTMARASAHPEAAPFDPEADADAALGAALARAATEDGRVLLVTGANWCHDSRALAGWLGTDRFRQLAADHFEVVYVDVGHPQAGEGRNLDVPRRFGHEQQGTPNLLVLTPEGLAVNADTAADWRNAASRSEDAIYDALVDLAHRPAPTGNGQDIAPGDQDDATR